MELTKDSQPLFTYSKSIMETPEQYVNSLQSTNKDIRKTLSVKHQTLESFDAKII